jgi:hypothetical protein
MGAWHQDGLADWLSVIMWLWLWSMLRPYNKLYQCPTVLLTNPKPTYNHSTTWQYKEPNTVKWSKLGAWEGSDPFPECRGLPLKAVSSTWNRPAIRWLDSVEIWRQWELEIVGSVVVKVLCYKLEGHRFDTQWGDFLNSPNPSVRSRPWGLLSL